ncbi:MAG: hypothetical protein GX958_06020 [Desulfitobacterium sp.]|nr:hypothetical protein [Desulfitobacterium sp.]
MTINSWKRGVQKGLETTWTLAKIVFPISIIVTILQYTPVIDIVSKFIEPILGYFGLPGEAALVLVLGNLLHLYAGIGVMLTMELTVKEVYILAVMLGISHSLPMETAICKKIGVSSLLVILIRLGLSFLFAFGVNRLWTGGEEKAQYLISPAPEQELNTAGEIILNALGVGVNSVIQIAFIVILVMIFIEVLKEIDVLPVLAKMLSPLTRLLGVSEKTGMTLLAGLLFGISYGAGVIIQAAKEDDLSKRDIILVTLFLITCHAVIEDTLLFASAGVNIFYLLLTRILLALTLTIATARVWLLVDKRLNAKNSSLAKSTAKSD